MFQRLLHDWLSRCWQPTKRTWICFGYPSMTSWISLLWRKRRDSVTVQVAKRTNPAGVKLIFSRKKKKNSWKDLLGLELWVQNKRNQHIRFADRPTDIYLSRIYMETFCLNTQGVFITKSFLSHFNPHPLIWHKAFNTGVKQIW